jgi:hypothetical protein
MAVVAVLCILALSVAASTLDSAEGGGGEGGLVGTVAGWLPIPNPTASEQSHSAGVREMDGDLTDSLSTLQQLFCIPALRDPLVQVGILAAYVVVVGAVVWGAEDVAERMMRAVGTMAVLGIPTVLFLFVFAFTMRGCTTGTADIPEGEIPAGTSGPSGGEGTVVETLTDPTVLAVVIGAVGLVVVALALVGSGDDDEDGEQPRAAEGLETTGGGGGTQVAAVARAAGAAADRIEASGAVDNEVYRAWREMTDDLEVANPRSSTPAEFRAAAVEAGIAAADVDELTELFEAVRYGGEAATEERERRAVEALRRIETGYGAGGSDGDDLPGGR